MNLKTKGWQVLVRQQILDAIQSRGTITVAEMCVLAQIPPEAVQRKYCQRQARKGRNGNHLGVTIGAAKSELISCIFSDLCKKGVCVVVQKATDRCRYNVYGLTEQQQVPHSKV